jgi:RNA polymerase sigma factor (sigma-70 family)
MANSRDQLTTTIDWSTVMRDHYATACRVIERLMPPSLRTTYDPEDFVGDAIVELMAHPDRFIEHGSALLILVAKRRMIDAVRSPRSRSGRLEVEIIDRQPPPVLKQEAAELRAKILGRVEDPGDREVVDLRCRGHTLPEIADLTGLGLRKLQRFWKRFTEANEPY